MVFASSLGLAIRHGAISRSSTVVPIRLCQSNLRSFSSVLQTRCSTHRYALRPSIGARSFFWKSNPTPSTPIPAAPTTPVEGIPSNVTETLTTNVPAEGITSNVTETLTTNVPAEGIPSNVTETLTTDVPAEGIPSNVTEALITNVPAEGIPSNLTETLITNVPAALQYGDMAALGLAGWSPAGIVRWSMELINVSTGMPWFWTIIIGSALWRVACVPWAIRGFQVSARLLPHQPRLLALQKSVAKARETQNPLELQKAAQAMSRFYKSHNISPLAGLVSLVQLPITFGLFFGVQKMCNLPVEQLRDSGVSFLPDLTMSDPTMILPITMFVLVNTQIKLSVRDFNTTERPEMAHLMNILRLMTVPGIYIMSSLPSGLLISLLTTGLLTILQTLILRIPAIRHTLKIPVIPIELQGKLPSFRDTFQRIRDYFGSDLKGKVDKARREAVARQRIERPRL
ncbi:hypothetical protein BYT27DRAFT_7127187 [Phlegmacium glaucopus]|nr:hypothetical protein BYT27DRAFT_7127187 [Phlegmacium glaucopus]